MPSSEGPAPRSCEWGPWGLLSNCFNAENRTSTSPRHANDLSPLGLLAVRMKMTGDVNLASLAQNHAKVARQFGDCQIILPVVSGGFYWQIEPLVPEFMRPPARRCPSLAKLPHQARKIETGQTGIGKRIIGAPKNSIS